MRGCFQQKLVQRLGFLSSLWLGVFPIHTSLANPVNMQSSEAKTGLDQHREFSQPLRSQKNLPNQPQNQAGLSPPTACPQELGTLTTQLLLDLPSYANRANTTLTIPNNYVIVASQPEFKPLRLGPGQRADRVETPADTHDPYQVFFTTLVRSYQSKGSVLLQQYHWLFLTRADSGWRLSMLYSIIGPYQTEGAPLPPRDSSEGSLAQAIRTWLRDCRFSSAD